MRNALKLNKGGAALAACLAVSLTSSAAVADAASGWVEGFNNKVRILAASASTGAHKTEPVAGIEIAMPAGWKTYWRNPGEAGGVPPEFDFSKSENLKSADVLYPAPHRLVDPKAGENIGYKDHVIFPVVVTAADTSKPVVLRLKASYGVCRDICVPAEAELELNLAPGLGPSAAIDAALAAVPAPREVGAPDAPALKSWRLEGGTKLVLDVTGADADAFLYAGDGLYMPMTKLTASDNDGAVFEADLAEGAKPEELKGKSVSVTLAGSIAASETLIQLP